MRQQHQKQQQHTRGLNAHWAHGRMVLGHAIEAAADVLALVVIQSVRASRCVDGSVRHGLISAKKRWRMPLGVLMVRGERQIVRHVFDTFEQVVDHQIAATGSSSSVVAILGERLHGENPALEQQMHVVAGTAVLRQVVAGRDITRRCGERSQTAGRDGERRRLQRRRCCKDR